MHDAAARFVAVVAVGCLVHADAEERILERERSLYQTILITEEPGRICMKFSLREEQRNQSCMDPDSPQRMVFTYARMMMAALLLVPEPERVLVAGLGGGTLPTALEALLPRARIDVAEIDAAVVRAARKHFAFVESDRLRVHVNDARVFVKRALGRGEQYDLVLLDAYSGDYIPEHLMTVEFLEETRSLLAPGGAVAANTFATSRLYDHESETYRAVFGTFFNLRDSREQQPRDSREYEPPARQGGRCASARGLGATGCGPTASPSWTTRAACRCASTGTSPSVP